MTPPPGSGTQRARFVSRLRQQTAAVRVTREKFGTRRALTRSQISTVAEEFDAQPEAISAAKKIIDTRDEKYRACVCVLQEAVSFWRMVSVPYPEKGIRLMRRERIEEFRQRMSEYRSRLLAAALELQARYAQLRSNAQQRLGTLFNDADYPARIDTEFDLNWDFPSVDPPEYLKNLNRELYDQQVALINARFEEAITLTEQAFAANLQKLVAHLAERLKGDVDGKPKIFRDSAVDNIKKFFAEFRDLDLGSSETLKTIVQQAEQALDGVSADDLRQAGMFRDQVTSQLAAITQQLDAVMVNRPKRAIDLSEPDQPTQPAQEAA